MLGEIDTGDPKVVKSHTDSSRPISSSTQAFYHRGDSDISNNNINNCCNNEFLLSGPSGRGRDHCSKLCKKKLFTENTSMDYYFIDGDNESINSAESRVNCETHLYNNYSDNDDKDVKKSVLNSSRVSNSLAESPVESSQRFRKLGDSKGRGSIDSEKLSRVENEWFVSYKSDECNLENNIYINNFSFNDNINISNNNSSDNDSSSFRSSSRSGKSYKLKDKCDRRIPCRRYYLQFAFLLFLIAFGGQTGVGAGIGIGVPRSSVLGIITVGTMFSVSGVKAAPVDLGDAGIRAERSANLSHLTGTSRKILMFIKNKYLQILPDGTVNGTENFTADYNIFQRISVSSGQLKIQGVATCLYLCMDSCGLLYGSREYTEDCVFNETLEAHNYNTYSSIRWSTPRKTLYVGLNRHGQPRRVQARGHNLGRLSSYARVMTVVVSPDRVENLQARMMGVQHKVRHHHVTHHQTQHHHHQQQHHQNLQQSVCPSFPSQEKDGRDRFRCRKRRKRKKRKRRCEKNDKVDSNCETYINIKEERPCPDTEDNINGSDDSSGKRPSCNYSSSADELSRRQLLNTSLVIKRKSRIDVINNKNEDRNNNNNSNHNNHTSKKKEGKNNKKLMRKVGFVDGTGTTAATDVQHQQEQPHQEEQHKGLVFKENSSLVKKKFPGRSIRTTVPAPSSENSNATLASWFTGATSTTQSSWEIFMKRTSSSPSPPTSRAIKLIDNPKKIPGDKDAQVSDPDVKGNATETSNVDDTSLSALETENLLTDGSSESEDDTLEEDSAYAGDYGVLMTTMDTTPPERTEDYAKTTTQSILESIEASRPLIDYLNRSVIDSSFPFRRLAM
ncbi:kinesin-related protein 12 [Microplitis demolitor]|uniref:kinesin-related protein 12 n=1 Tax=Microplitis demolitor TaxID=69319 RepID=UPI0004CD5383|nr:kinesin-related protein 12 [Microplitis demolitor]